MCAEKCRGACACGGVPWGEPGASVLLRAVGAGAVRSLLRRVLEARRLLARVLCRARAWRALPLGGLHSVGAGEEPPEEREGALRRQDAGVDVRVDVCK